MFYMPTHCTLGGHVAGVKLYPPILLDADYLLISWEGNERYLRRYLNFKFKSLAGWRELEFLRLSGTDVLVGGF